MGFDLLLKNCNAGWRKRWVGLLACAAVIALTGCATAYQPKGATGGFSEKLVGPARYYVEFQGNGNTSAGLVSNMFLYRCAELTVRDGFDVFGSDRTGSPTSLSDGAMAPRVSLMAAPAADEQITEFRSSGGAIRYIPIYTPTTPVIFHRMTGTIRMARFADVPSDYKVWDARAVMRMLEPVVRGTGVRIAMTSEQLARAAMVQGRSAAGGGSATLNDLRRLLEP